VNALQKYFQYRQALIEQYIRGDMTKREYLDKNLDAVFSLRKTPFEQVDSVDKGLFNYQYFNALAKEAFTGRDCYFGKDADYYYHKKDGATAAVLQLMHYRGVSAYMIHARSRFLNGKLFEIVLEDYGMILHCANRRIRERLEEEGVFCPEKRLSLIDGYINQRY